MQPITLKKTPPAKELAQVRSIATLYAEPIQLIVRAESSYQSPNDLKRQPVAISAPLDRQAKLLALWSKPLRFAAQPAYLTTLEDDLKALADGRIEAVLTIGAGPVQAVADQAARSKLRLLPITGAEQPGMAQPCLISVRIDASAYPGIGETPTLALTTQLITRQDAPPDLVYGVTKALWNGATRKLLAGGTVEAQDVRIDNSILGLAVGLHPGASRYYREMGVLRTTALAETPK
jgi:TRAP transporter TAXI family solute receptor